MQKQAKGIVSKICPLTNVDLTDFFFKIAEGVVTP